MNPRSARTLLWVSALLAVVGGTIGSPEAGLAILALAAVSALVPVVAGCGKTRIIGAILLLAAIGSAWLMYPAAKRQMQEYRGRTTGGETKTP